MVHESYRNIWWVKLGPQFLLWMSYTLTDFIHSATFPLLMGSLYLTSLLFLAYSKHSKYFIAFAQSVSFAKNTISPHL